MNANFLNGAGELGKLIQAIDWSGTTLGPLEDWPTPVTTTLGIVLNSSVPMVTLWGEDGIMIYNEAYSRLAGGRTRGCSASRCGRAGPKSPASTIAS